jgi:hypothetical protein
MEYGVAMMMPLRKDKETAKLEKTRNESLCNTRHWDCGDDKALQANEADVLAEGLGRWRHDTGDNLEPETAEPDASGTHRVSWLAGWLAGWLGR